MERAFAQVELLDVITELADVAWQREAGVIAVEVDLPGPHALLFFIAEPYPHANELERQLACARRGERSGT